jgi:hypothetical protein
MCSLINGLLAVAITATVLTRPADAAEPVLITPKVLIAENWHLEDNLMFLQ